MTAEGVSTSSDSASASLTLRRELARKALHVTSVALPIAYAAGTPRDVLLALLVVLALAAVLVELGRARSARLRERFVRATGVLLRAHEHQRLSGATWLLLAFVLTVALFPPPVAIAAMWGVSVGDASAAVVGRLASHRATGAAGAASGGKTWAGSLACAAATFAGALLLAHLTAAESAVAAVAAALGERPARPLDDNLRIVLAVGGGILLWRMAFS